MKSTCLVAIGIAGTLCQPSWAATAANGNDDRTGSTNLIEAVRRATRDFWDVSAATEAGYAPFGGCVSGPERGAMGLHYANSDLVGDGMLDPQKPDVLLYEWRNGRLRLLGVEFVVIAEAWDAANEGPPSLMGQQFHYATSPNRYGLPPFYELHVWAWRDNPFGAFVDWNPLVSCDNTGGHEH